MLALQAHASSPSSAVSCRIPVGAEFPSTTRTANQSCSREHRARLFAVTAQAEGAAPAAAPKVAKGSIVRVNQEKYLNSIEFTAVDHPPYFKGLDYIYQARGEVLDLRSFPSGEYALISWAGIPTAPAWLPVYLLEKAPKLDYKRV